MTAPTTRTGSLDGARRRRWLGIAGPLLLGLFVAYLDRSNLSVGLKNVSVDLGFAGAHFPATSSLVLTAFLIGYLVSNFLGGLITHRIDTKVVLLVTIAGLSVCTLLTGFVDSVGLLVFLRVALGVFEGIYWPQQFRIAKAWFDEREMSRASAMIQYYGQYLALALGFFILTPIDQSVGWRPMFWVLGGIGIAVIVPLYAIMLKSSPTGPHPVIIDSTGPRARTKLSFSALGGPRFLLIVFSYFANGMLFWGITLFIPLVVPTFGFAPGINGLLSALPYLVSLALTVPMTIISDRTGKRIAIAASGLLVGGVLVGLLPLIDSPIGKLLLITVGVGYFTATYTSNIWAVVVNDLEPAMVGPATGIVNGVGAGGGGVIAGVVVGGLLSLTGSYFAGLGLLGLVAILGGIAVIVYGRTGRRSGRSTASAAAAR